MVLELRKHVRDGDLKSGGIGISQIIQITGSHEMVQGEDMEGTE